MSNNLFSSEILELKSIYDQTWDLIGDDLSTELVHSQAIKDMYKYLEGKNLPEHVKFSLVEEALNVKIEVTK